jgi:N5-(carboxyethyl)ornithine synthase
VTTIVQNFHISSISFVKPNYPHESRVALLPEGVRHLRKVEGGAKILIEHNFGETLGFNDSDYEEAGAEIISREEAFDQSVIFSLKLIQPIDYTLLKREQTIVGWTHPNGSGREFWENECIPKNIQVIDLDSIHPKLWSKDQITPLEFLGSHFFWKNSYIAGQASIELAKDTLPGNSEIKIAVLGSGSVSQGAFQSLSSLGFSPRMFYRKTMHHFYESLSDYEIIVNGIENDQPDSWILSAKDLALTKENVLIIDAAADAGNAVFGTEFQSIERPFGTTCGRNYLLVNNAPTVFPQRASENISTVLSEQILPKLFR